MNPVHALGVNLYEDDLPGCGPAKQRRTPRFYKVLLWASQMRGGDGDTA